MATYRDIKGDLVETVASDPTNSIEGDIWYNTTTGTLKGLGFKAAAWASGGDGTGTVLYDGTTFATNASIAASRGELSAAGNAPGTAGIIFCGSPVPGVGNKTEEFTGETSAQVAKTIQSS